MEGTMLVNMKKKCAKCIIYCCSNSFETFLLQAILEMPLVMTIQNMFPKYLEIAY